jgi:acyl-CoA hydrolase
MTLEEHIKIVETHQCRMVMSDSLNDNGILFGGNTLKWMDEVAYITAQRFSRMKVVTIAVERVKFHKAIHQGAMIDIIGKVSNAGRVKIEILVEIVSENLQEHKMEKVAEAIFIFAPIDHNFKPKGLDLSFIG